VRGRKVSPTIPDEGSQNLLYRLLLAHLAEEREDDAEALSRRFTGRDTIRRLTDERKTPTMHPFAFANRN
jgi:hypothetical protein